jgi:hypothetical protein
MTKTKKAIKKPAKDTIVMVGSAIGQHYGAAALRAAGFKPRFLGYTDGSTTAVAFRVHDAGKAQEALWDAGFGWVQTTTLKRLREGFHYGE